MALFGLGPFTPFMLLFYLQPSNCLHPPRPLIYLLHTQIFIQIVKKKSPQLEKNNEWAFSEIKILKNKFNFKKLDKKSIHNVDLDIIIYINFYYQILH